MLALVAVLLCAPPVGHLLVSLQSRRVQGGATGAAADQGQRPGHDRRRSPLRGHEVIALAAALVLSLQGEQPTPPQPAPEDIQLLPIPAAPDAETVARQ